MKEYPKWAKVLWAIGRGIIAIVFAWLVLKFPLTRELLGLLANGLGIREAFDLLVNNLDAIVVFVGVLVKFISVIGKLIRMAQPEDSKARLLPF